MKFNLRGYRAAMGLSQQKFADQIGMAHSTYYSKEKGIRKFTPDEMLRITNYIKERYHEADMQTIFFDN